jgi:hypothetical protein
LRTLQKSGDPDLPKAKGLPRLAVGQRGNKERSACLAPVNLRRTSPANLVFRGVEKAGHDGVAGALVVVQCDPAVYAAVTVSSHSLASCSCSKDRHSMPAGAAD